MEKRWLGDVRYVSARGISPRFEAGVPDKDYDSSMTRALATTASWLLLCSLSFGQEDGYRDLSFPNTTGQGSSTLSARVYYPATSSGANTPMVAPPAGGYPVVVFLHGWTQTGASYSKLGTYLSKKGYVAVLNNTAQFSFSTQADDGKAYFGALVTANAQAGNFLQGALDMSRVGLSGHSAGGGNTVTVLADNPGYRCGVLFAPIDPGAATNSQVEVPLAIIHGEGDLVLLWQLTALDVYNEATNVRGLRTFYRMDFGCGHNNLAGLFHLTSTDQDVWRVTKRVMRGFFDHYLSVNQGGLDRVIGVAARAESRLSQLYLSVEAPTLWTAGNAALGQTITMHVASEPGPVVLAAGNGLAAPLPTPLGDLLLDPGALLTSWLSQVGADRYSSEPLAIPSDPSLVGFQLALQALGTGTGAGPALSGAVVVTVQP